MTQKPDASFAVPPRQLNILAVEDSPFDAELLLQELRRAGLNVRMDVAKTAVEVVAFLLGGSYDVVLSDFNLRGWTGLDALQLLRERQSDLPFILVTGSLGEEKAAECIKLGAADFVLKDRLSRLPHAIARALEEKRLREQQLASEEALRRSEANLRSLVENAPYAIYKTNVDAGRFVSVNPALVKMLGYDSEAEVLALHLPTQVYRDPAARARLLPELERHEKFENLVLEWKRQDGKLLLLRSSGRLAQDEAGNRFFEAIAEDITERRLLEEQFRQAQKMEAIGQLAGGVAHDFNNLLMVMSSFSEMVSEAGPTNEKQQHYLQEVLKATRRAAALTGQLLAFSRKQLLAPTVLDMNSITAEFGRMLPRLIGEHIKVQLLAKASNARVQADRGQLEQVLMNLAVNARDAMPKGGTLILEVNEASFETPHIGTGYNIPPGSYVMLAVSDTGEGMDAETQTHIFEPFFTTKELGKGTGLGLATVYGIVKQSGGYISVYSEKGVGTTFKMYFPQVDKTLSADSGKAGEPKAAGGKETILLVEDEQALRVAAREFLGMKGYTVLEAADGAEALSVHSQHTGRVHLLVTDVVMPGGSGRELAEKLHRLDPRLRVLFISGYTGGSVGSMAGLDAAASFLQKPFALESLARTVRSLLDATPQAASGA